MKNKESFFSPEPFWAKLPHPIFFKEATSVSVDSEDNVYVFNRGEHPLIIFDKNGNFIKTIGEGEFIRPHGIEIDSEDNLYLVDDLGHFVQKRSKNGEIIFTIGQKEKPCEWQSGGYFNRPTDIAINPSNGDLFITDGYGNSRIHKFDKNGKHILSWGNPGAGEGQFSLPHNITMLGDDRVVMCDRENFRLQVFTLEGEFVSQHHMHRPQAITSFKDSYLLVAEAGTGADTQIGVPNLGLSVKVLDYDFNFVTSFGDEQEGEGADQFISPHGITVDSNGSIYIAEVSYTNWSKRKDIDLSNGREPISFRKWNMIKSL
ncbi:MAG: peptidylglycine alpha-amidating monooxygenase [Chloroflexi bacterium]|nr:peptidylglycine alpha-amidating monooxygenase [Chloroflexota bacterium]|tara:strand:- start:2412 stop:3362 length:951 start_codon:yes stop_codon:yes gene_type:complete